MGDDLLSGIRVDTESHPMMHGCNVGNCIDSADGIAVYIRDSQNSKHCGDIASKVRSVDCCPRGPGENGGTSAASIGRRGPVGNSQPDGATAILSHDVDTGLFQLPCLVRIESGLKLAMRYPSLLE
ncbi:hypothetical protein PCH_Pc20g15560 [Penicillium rubens Wisconsin 54-1255]|uniref:Uncharacterized protein n=1 Tax=Penicillium rubens (strain ATCC 28089 / DSM 1075 / NRRL 1951 / Wisconsin 54-1255) TaxID=500485 RepID=B6HE10_PENRW|nr:hypothetical protein PCH_Pc20g15560 [Penicillium rubens Wisconsin 54-1255]